MNTVTGVISKKFVDMRNTKFGPKEATSFVIDGIKYSGGFKKYSANEGDSVSITYETTPQGYHNVSNLVLVGQAAGGNRPATGASKSGYRQAGSEGGFPLHPLAYERALDRRNALQCAVAWAAQNGSKMAPEKIVEVARTFEDYTTGDSERKAAEKDFNESMADPYNFDDVA